MSAPLEPVTAGSGEPTTVQYRRLVELASGGMGSVTLCVRRSGTFQRLYAVKRLHTHLREDASMQAMFLEEARVAGLVRHANVVSVLDLGEDAEGPFLVMDYIEGVSLSRFIKHHVADGERPPAAVCAHIVSQVARGLHAAHELLGPDGEPLQLVHRDVSPQNVIVGHDGVVRVTDFGIAKALGRSAHTSTGLLKGKAGYMSPEQLRFESPDRRSDLFALGVVLHELLVSHRLYSGREVAEVARAILNEPVPDIGDERPDLPPAVVQLVFQLLAKDVADRPATAGEVADRLDDSMAEYGQVDLAGYVASRFAEELESRRALIRERLATLPDVGRSATESSPTNDSVTVAELRAGATSPASPARRLLAPAVGVLVAALAGAGLWVSAGPPGDPARAADDTKHPPGVEAGVVTVVVDSRPPGALVRLEDRDRGITPLQLQLPRGEEPLSVELDLEGFASSTHDLVPNADQRLVIAMTVEVEPPPVTAGRPKTSTSAQPKTPRPSRRRGKDRKAAPVEPTPPDGRPRFRRFD